MSAGPSKKRNVPLVLGLVGLQIAAYTAQSVLTKLSLNSKGHFDYDANSAVLLTEAAKFGIALMSVVRSGDVGKLGLEAKGTAAIVRKSLLFAFPAAAYILHNNLIYVAHIYLSPPSYQLLNNIKIISTGLVFRLMLRRRLLVIQWVALLQLALGMAVTSLGGDCNKGGQEGTGDVSTFIMGVGVMIVIALCSSFAGVYSEVLIKTSGLPVQVGNVWLYSFGIVTATATYLVQKKPDQGLLDGYSPSVWGCVFTNSVLGLVISFIFKHGDNIVKLFGASSGVLLTAAVSTVLFDYKPPVSLWLGYALVACSLFLYYGEQGTLYGYDSDIFGCPNLPCIRKADERKDLDV